MSQPTVIAFCRGKKYKVAACTLFGDLVQIDHPFKIHDSDLKEHMALLPEGTRPRKWVCRFIPSFILSQLDELQTDVLYLHVDFRVQKPIPDVFDGLDIGLQRRWFWKPDESNLPMLAAPIFARNNEAARRFLRIWEALCLNVHDGNYEHGHLFRTWQIMQDRDRTCRIGFFPENIGSVAAEADCAIVGHKRVEDEE